MCGCVIYLLYLFLTNVNKTSFSSHSSKGVVFQVPGLEPEVGPPHLILISVFCDVPGAPSRTRVCVFSTCAAEGSTGLCILVCLSSVASTVFGHMKDSNSLLIE